MAALWVVVVVLSIAVAVLFTMLGQLAARLAELGPAPARDRVRRLTELRRGGPAPPWPGPPPTPQPGHPGLYAVVVLSTVCAASTRLAAQLSATFGGPVTPPLPLGIAVSAPRASDASRFVQQYALERLPMFIDERDRWSREQLGIAATPSLILIRDGHVLDGFTLSDVGDVAVIAAMADGRQPALPDQRLGG